MKIHPSKSACWVFASCVTCMRSCACGGHSHVLLLRHPTGPRMVPVVSPKGYMSSVFGPRMGLGGAPVASWWCPGGDPMSCSNKLGFNHRPIPVRKCADATIIWPSPRVHVFRCARARLHAQATNEGRSAVFTKRKTERRSGLGWVHARTPTMCSVMSAHGMRRPRGTCARHGCNIS